MWGMEVVKGIMKEAQRAEEQPKAGWRFRTGVVIFVVGFLSPLLIPLVARTGLPTAWKVGISGALAVGIPEVFSLAAIAIMGKEGFMVIKGWFLRFLKKYGPPATVSRTRYRIGLVIFLMPLVFGWSTPYVFHFIPEYWTHHMVYGLIGDMALLVGLFVLGGDFWDKLRALFIYGARAQFSELK
jgi:hypothetical protein